MGAAESREVAVRFGPAGWSYPDWNAPVYARSPRDALETLAGVFDCVEINTSFYRPPAASVAQNWLGRVRHNPDFRFSAKLWRRFTHERQADTSDVALYQESLAPILEAGLLGALLAQFPFGFKRTPQSWEYVSGLAQQFRGWPLVVEFRHRSWDEPEILDGLTRRGVSFCNVDQPALPDCLALTAHASGELGYVRLHGRNRESWFRQDAGRDARYDYRYAGAELDAIHEQVKSVASRARRVFVVTNNHFAGSAVVNAVQLQHRFRGRPVSVPGHWLRAFPELSRIAQPQPGSNRELFSESDLRAS